MEGVALGHSQQVTHVWLGVEEMAKEEDAQVGVPAYASTSP